VNHGIVFTVPNLGGRKTGNHFQKTRHQFHGHSGPKEHPTQFKPAFNQQRGNPKILPVEKENKAVNREKRLTPPDNLGSTDTISR